MSALAPRVTAFLLNCDCSTFFRQKLSNNQGGMNRIYPVCQSTPNWAFQGPQNWCPKPSYGAPPFSVCRPRETTQQFPISWSPQNRPPTMVHGIPFLLMTPGRHVGCPRPAPWWPQRAIFWRHVFANFLKTKIATLYYQYSSAKK